MEVADVLTGTLYAFAVLATLAGAWAGRRGVRLLIRALRCADDPSAPLWVIRGIRGIAVAVGGAALVGGVLFEQVWLLVFGAIFLAEELYETGGMALILRVGQRQSAGDLKRPAADLARAVPDLVIVGRRQVRSSKSWRHNLPTLAKGREGRSPGLSALDPEWRVALWHTEGVV